MLKKTISVISCFLLVVGLKAQDGVLDSSFAAGGTLDINPSLIVPRDMILQPDGKIILAGGGTDSIHSGFCVARLMPDGSPDMGFGTGGHTITPVGVFPAGAHSVKLQADGKILLAGNSFYPGFVKYFEIVRYNSNGSLDSTFGTNGVVHLSSFPFYLNEKIYLQIKPDGKIVLGTTYRVSGSDYKFLFLQFNNDGSPDNTFSSDGIHMVDFGPLDHLRGLAIQDDGKILATGFAYDHVNSSIATCRLLLNSDPDSSFAGTGKLVQSVPGQSAMATALTLLDDGKILLAGGYINQSCLIRLMDDGSADPLFGTGGMMLNDYGFYSENLTEILIQPDGKILLSGQWNYSISAMDQDWALARCLSNGAPDPSFGVSGITFGDFGGSEYISAQALQSDGKILVLGHIDMGTDTIQRVLARYNTGLVGMPHVQSSRVPISIFPNPAGQTFMLKGIENISEMLILDMAGKLVLNNGNYLSADISDLPRGIYLVRVQKNEEVFYSKLVKN